MGDATKLWRDATASLDLEPKFTFFIPK